MAFLSPFVPHLRRRVLPFVEFTSKRLVNGGRNDVLLNNKQLPDI